MVRHIRKSIKSKVYGILARHGANMSPTVLRDMVGPVLQKQKGKMVTRLVHPYRLRNMMEDYRSKATTSHSDNVSPVDQSNNDAPVRQRKYRTSKSSRKPGNTRRLKTSQPLFSDDDTSVMVAAMNRLSEHIEITFLNAELADEPN